MGLVLINLSLLENMDGVSTWTHGWTQQTIIQSLSAWEGRLTESILRFVEDIDDSKLCQSHKPDCGAGG